MKKTNLITEIYYENGERRERVKLFDYQGTKYMATWDGKLIPHKYAMHLIDRIFKCYYDEYGNLIDQHSLAKILFCFGTFEFIFIFCLTNINSMV